MWIAFAFGSALFAGITSILAKIGIRNVDSNLATALRTWVVLIFSWLMVFVVGSQNTITALSGKSLLFLLLSGLTTGASWICYFRALQLGDVNKVTPVDKSSNVLTMMLAFVFLGERLTWSNAIGMVVIAAGTYMMIQKSKSEKAASAVRRSWLVYACLSALFAALTSILGKIGIEGVESNLGTAIRTIVVLLMAWLIVFAQKKQREIKRIDRKSWLFITLSGLATGLSWLCFYKALQDGPASVVVPIDKLSILITVLFAFVFLKEKLSLKSTAGLVLLTAGTLLLLLKG
ncbi:MULTISPECIES: EamA family transporter [Paenibacillus]|uniref:Multidrug DMT transporter permease n=1 Tax=Paenibacillus albilobatus TaxID=2716884 RepID=A0A920CFC0_9BACL|nr:MULTISPECIES: EamA family transporter [Paenibacillus]MDR9855828.1 EamA family transporter [Paenibacillus sp. VCA1]GIO34839.1 multidrug DMT transporter permease [Paenibacillus albilobatus]